MWVSIPASLAEKCSGRDKEIAASFAVMGRFHALRFRHMALVVEVEDSFFRIGVATSRATRLQRIMGFGSYKTAWSWLHKLRAALLQPDRKPLSEDVEIDETFIGGKRLGKPMVLVAVERAGRVRLAHARRADEPTLKRFADTNVKTDADVTSDGLASYNPRSLGDRAHHRSVQKPAERAANDGLQHVHWVASLLKRWLLGTHAGAVRAQHLQAYLDEFAFRYNRRRTNGVARIAARTIEGLVTQPTRTMRQIIDRARPYPAFRT